VKGQLEYCHVTNSGRLKELLYPGARVGLVDHSPKLKTKNSKLKTSRKTRYAVRLAYYRKKWVCIEANIAPKLLNEAWEEGLIPSLRRYDLLKAEVLLDRHTRFDFQAQDSGTGNKAWIEVKCVTLVGSDGIARFPDAPSERASKHLRELMVLGRRPKTQCFVFFILQNPYGRAVGPKEDTDPIFAKTLRKAAQSKVKLEAFRAEITWRGARLERSIGVLR
jgi:sugar fermentation stimulation protein A